MIFITTPTLLVAYYEDMGEPLRKPRISSSQRTTLRVIQGEGDVTRFERADRVTKGLGELFFKTGRISPGHGVHINVFRQALQQVQYKPSELAVYEDWLALNRFDAIKQGEAGIKLPGLRAPNFAAQDAADERVIHESRKRLAYLTAHDDPLAHVIDTLELVRVSEFPEIANDTKSLRKAQLGYAAGIASVHGALFKPEA